MTRVAEEADVSLATLYRYFESKDMLLDSAFRREAGRVEEPWRTGAWDAHKHDDVLTRYARVIHGYTLDWAKNDRALGLMLTLAESPGLLYAFLLDKVEVYEHWIRVSLVDVIEDPKWTTAHAVTSASAFYSLLIRWARGRLRSGRPDLPRNVPSGLPDRTRRVHVPQPCDFTAEELALWYTRRRLLEYATPVAEVDAIVARVVAERAEGAEGAIGHAS